MDEPIIINKPLPGEAVDRHLKRFGHLPTTDLCDEIGSCVREHITDGTPCWCNPRVIKVESNQPLSKGSITQMPDGSWQDAKQEPYYNMGFEWLRCFFGFHEWFISKKYHATKTCFRCGKRKTGCNHY